MVTLSEAYRTFKNKYAIYLLPLVFGVILYVLAISAQVIYIVVAIGYFLLITPNIQKLVYEKYSQKDDEDKAWDYLKTRWYAKSKESLSLRNGSGTSRYFGKSLFYAFVINRGDVGDKKYLPFVGVVQLEPLRVAYWSDNPTSDIIDDPFKSISPVFIGSPSADMRADLEPSLRSGYQDKKQKKETPENENEPQSNDMVIEE